MILRQIDIWPMPPQIHHTPYILHPIVLGNSHQKFSNLIQLSIVHIVDEARTIDGILGMEHVTGRRIIYDDDLTQIAIQQAQILDVIAFVEDAGFAKEAGAYDAMRVEEIEQNVGVLVETGGVDYDFVMLRHFQ